MHIIIGGDHAGFSLKQKLLPQLAALGHDIEDIGSFTPDPVDFPDITQTLCAKVKARSGTRGLLVCGTGVGVVIAANKIRGIRAAVCHDVHSARQAVEHDDVNVMCLGAQIVGDWLALDLIETFLQARFVPEADFVRRLEKLAKFEQM